MSTSRDPTEFFEAIGLVRRRIQVHAKDAYAPLGLGPQQAKLVRHIGRLAPVSQAELARETDTDRALLGRIIEALVERGLVTRARGKEDRREWILDLTAEGKRVRARIEKLRRDLAAHIVAGIDERDLAAFDRIAKQILAKLG